MAQPTNIHTYKLLQPSGPFQGIHRLGDFTLQLMHLML